MEIDSESEAYTVLNLRVLIEKSLSKLLPRQPRQHLFIPFIEFARESLKYRGQFFTKICSLTLIDR